MIMRSKESVRTSPSRAARTVTAEAARIEFHALAAELQRSGASGAAALAALVHWYTEARIAGADPGQDDDLLQLVAGTAEIDELGERQFVSVDRLVCADGDDEQAALGFTMIYGPATGTEPQITDVFVRPGQEAVVAAFLEQPFVVALLERVPDRHLVTVAGI